VIDKARIRTHMRRFKLAASQHTNSHIVFLHLHCQMSLDTISEVTGISRKTITRMLLGQLPTKTQIRLLQRAVNAATYELESMLTYERQSREGMYAGAVITQLSHLGRSLGRHEIIKGKTRA